MASSSSVDMIELIELLAEELLISKPNSRILKVEAYVSRNKLGKPFFKTTGIDLSSFNSSVTAKVRKGLPSLFPDT